MRRSPSSQPGHPLPPALTGLTGGRGSVHSNKACWEGAATVPVSHQKAATSLSCGNQGLGRSRVRPKVTQSALQRFRPGPSEGKPGVFPQLPWDRRGMSDLERANCSYYLSRVATGWPSGPLEHPNWRMLGTISLPSFPLSP